MLILIFLTSFLYKSLQLYPQGGPLKDVYRKWYAEGQETRTFSDTLTETALVLVPSPVHIMQMVRQWLKSLALISVRIKIMFMLVWNIQHNAVRQMNL